jgi:kynurenine aminotransferase
MNFLPPAFLRDAAADAVNSLGASHYQLPRGNMRLRTALVVHYGDSFSLGRQLNPATEILVTAGANLGTYSYVSFYSSIALLFPRCVMTRSKLGFNRY